MPAVHLSIRHVQGDIYRNDFRKRTAFRHANAFRTVVNRPSEMLDGRYRNYFFRGSGIVRVSLIVAR